MLKDPIWKLLLMWIGFAAGIILLALLSSCNVLKKSSSVSKDSTSVVKVDTGRVVKNEVNKTDSMAWWREIINFSRDTTIVTSPVTNVYPTSYIREGGVREIKTKEINYDSLWNNKMDSLVSKLQTVDKYKSVKTPGVWMMWLAIGISLITLLSRFLTIKK